MRAVCLVWAAGGRMRGSTGSSAAPASAPMPQARAYRHTPAPPTPTRPPTPQSRNAALSPASSLGPVMSPSQLPRSLRLTARETPYGALSRPHSHRGPLRSSPESLPTPAETPCVALVPRGARYAPHAVPLAQDPHTHCLAQDPHTNWLARAWHPHSRVVRNAPPGSEESGKERAREREREKERERERKRERERVCPCP